MREARRFFEELPEWSVQPTAVVFNRELPHEWETITTAPSNVANGAGIAARDWAALRDNLMRWAAEARRTADARTEFAARYGTDLASIPWLTEPPTDLDALADMVDQSEGLTQALFG